MKRKKSSEIGFQARQGDVLVERRAAVDESKATAVPQEGGRVVLAHGEATGHAHALPGPAAFLFEMPKKTRVLRMRKREELLHEEHHRPEIDKVIALARGDYDVIRQREYVPEEISRNVAD